MFSIFKFINSVWQKSWWILNPNLSPMRNSPTHIKYFGTIFLASLWCIAFGIYTAQFFYIGINLLAHVGIITMCFVTWYCFKLFLRKYPDPYPLMRDPSFSPKCYELTDIERLAAIAKADKLLKEKEII